MLSNIHLATDARHRATVLVTYLAMLKNDKVTEKERTVILESVFRPIATGLVKDTDSPPSMFEVLEKVMQR